MAAFETYITTAELNRSNRDHVAHKPKHLLAGPLQTSFSKAANSGRSLLYSARHQDKLSVAICRIKNVVNSVHH